MTENFPLLILVMTVHTGGKVKVDLLLIFGNITSVKWFVKKSEEAAGSKFFEKEDACQKVCYKTFISY